VKKMTVIDCKAIFSLQKQIINAPKLTDAEKLKMIENSINETLGIDKEAE
jgi:hypothetical protein